MPVSWEYLFPLKDAKLDDEWNDFDPFPEQNGQTRNMPGRGFSATASWFQVRFADTSLDDYWLRVSMDAVGSKG